MTVYLASYRGGARGLSRIVGAVIRWVTRSEWSHCEIAIGNPLEGPAICVSASGMDGGVRAKEMQLDPSRWTVTPLPHVRVNQVYTAINAFAGAPYDWAGVARFALPWAVRSEHPNRWFCSEFCAHVIGLEEPWRFSPADLKIVASKIEEAGGV